MCLGHTGQRADHGESSEGAGQPLSTHDGSGVGGRQDPCQPEQTALKDRPEGWEGHRKQGNDVNSLYTLKSHFHTEKTLSHSSRKRP